MGLEAFETSTFPTGLIAEVQKCIVLRRASNASHDFSPLREPPNSQTLPKRGGCFNFPCLLHPKFQATVPTLHFWHGSDSSKNICQPKKKKTNKKPSQILAVWFCKAIHPQFHKTNLFSAYGRHPLAKACGYRRMLFRMPRSACGLKTGTYKLRSI